MTPERIGDLELRYLLDKALACRPGEGVRVHPTELMELIRGYQRPVRGDFLASGWYCPDGDEFVFMADWYPEAGNYDPDHWCKCEGECHILPACLCGNRVGEWPEGCVGNGDPPCQKGREAMIVDATAMAECELPRGAHHDT